MRIGVPKETAPGERRVALVPEVVKKLTGQGHTVVVQAGDVRAAVKEQVESLGAKFLEFDLGGDLEGEGGYARELTPEQQARQQELMAEAIGKVDVVITTAAVPGRRAPVLVTEEAVKLMKPGSVIIDLAGEAG